MTGRRPRMLLVAALGLAAGLLAGLRLAPRMEPATRAAAPEPVATIPGTAPLSLGPDFIVNVRSELIGINTAIYSETGGYQGIGFAVPSNLARQVVQQLTTNGRVVRGWVGITRIADVAEDGQQEGPGGDASGGALLVELLRDSPADRGGLEPGDVVVEVDGRGVQNAAQLRNELARAQVGAQLRVTVLREGRRRVLRVSVEEAGAGA